MTDIEKKALREACRFGAWVVAVVCISTAIVFVIDLAIRRIPDAPARAPTSFCCDEVLQGPGRCSHVKHTLLRANEAGSLWVCLCDPYR